MASKRVDRKFRRVITAAALAISATALLAPTASAGLLTESAPSCTNQVLETPFAQFGDSANYTLIGDGSFENGAAGWQLSRAGVVSGSNPYQVNGGDHTKALQISSGGVATSPEICVGLEHPTMRFFVKSSGGLLSLSTLSVEVIVTTSLGLKAAVPIGVTLPNAKWRPGARHVVVANLLPLLPDNYTPVAFRFRANGGATWTIDDVYVDPMRRG